MLLDFGNPTSLRSLAVPRHLCRSWGRASLRRLVCVRARPFARTPLPYLRDLIFLLSPRFGFYKYMKMDEEEEDPRQRAFLFLNPDSESLLPAGSFLGISHQLGMELSTGILAHQAIHSEMWLIGMPPVMLGGLEEGWAAQSSLPLSSPARSVVTHPAQLSHKALWDMGVGWLGLGFALPNS